MALFVHLILQGFGNLPRAEAIDIDEAQLISGQATPLLRWDNLEGAPHWLAGTPLRYDKRSRWHVAQLEPAAYATLQVPAGRILRLNAIGSDNLANDIQLWTSNGSGIYRPLPLGQVEEDGSLLVALDEYADALVRIERTTNNGNSLCVAFFLAHPMEVPDAWRYNNSLPCGDRVCRWEASDAMMASKTEPFSWLPAAGTMQWMIEGPRRMRLETRLAYPPYEARSRQAYRVNVGMKPGLSGTFELETTCDRTVHGVGDTTIGLVGLTRVVYWNVPAGLHRVQITATDPLWLRASTTDSLPSVGLSSPSCNFPWDQYDSLWDLCSAPEALQFHVREGLSVQRQRAMLRARDNRLPHGGIDAWQFQALISRHYPLSRELMRETDATLTMHARFRGILPAASSGPLEFREGRFVERRLDLDKTKSLAFTVSPSQWDDALQTVLSGQFARLAPGGFLDYWLVAPENASRVRVVVDKQTLTDGAEMMVQVDQGIAFPVRYLAPQTEAETYGVTATGDAMLSALSAEGRESLPPTLSGPFDARKSAGSWRDVATTEFRLQPGSLRIRVTNSSDHDCWLCLQQTDTRAYRMSEMDWRQCVAAVKDWPALFRQILLRMPLSASCGSENEELRNHYEPLVAELERRRDAFTRGLQLPATGEQSGPAEGKLLSHSQANDLLKSARQLAREKQWSSALATWTQLIHGVTHDARREAILGRIDTLLVAGERYLAEQELKGRFLDDDDEGLRDDAFQRLRELYQADGDTRKLRNLVAAAALQNPTHDRLLALAEQQIADDEVEDALSIILALAPEDRPLDLLGHVALAANWWQTADEAITACEHRESANYWRARWLMQQGEVDAAIECFEQAGESGEAWAIHVKQAIQIEARLGQSKESARWQAILDWEVWESNHPGPRVWREETELIVQSAGTDRIRANDSVHDSEYFVAQPTEPLELLVQGPVQLRLHARPLHASTALAPLNEQLVVNGQGKRWLWRISDNIPAQDLRSLLFRQATVGSLETWEVPLGPGRHRLQIAPGSHTTLLQAFVLRPQTRIPVLPRLTPSTVDAAAAKASIVYGLEAGYVTRVSYLEQAESRTTMPVFPISSYVTTLESPLFAQLESDARARASLRLARHEPAARTVLLEWIDRLPPSEWTQEQAEILARFAESSDARWQRLPTQQVSIPWIGAISAQRDWKRLRQVETGEDQEALVQLVNILQYRAEQQPKDQVYVLARIVQLAQRYPELTWLQDLVRDMEASGRWVAFREVQESAGVRRVRTAGPLTTNQSARIRLALMKVANDDPFVPTHLLATSSPAAIPFERKEATELAIVIRPMRGQFETPIPQTWQVLLDGRPLETIECTDREAEVAVKITVTAGPHTLGLQTPEGTTMSQYAAAMVAQLASGEKLQPLEEFESDDVGQRLVYVATPGQPIRFQPRGPALFRVEQLALDGAILNMHKMAVIDSVVADVELTAKSGQTQAYFRILEHQVVPSESKTPSVAPVDDRLSTPEELPVPSESQPIPLAFSPTSVDEVMTHEERSEVAMASYEAPSDEPMQAIAALRALSPDAPVTLIPAADAIPLGSHEDGTWGWTLGATTRRPVDEGRNQGAPDQFLQLGGNYQEYNEELDRYTRTQGVARLRDESGPSFGMIHERWSPLTGMGQRVDAFQGLPIWTQRVAEQLRLDQEWYAYLQQPSDPLPGKEESLEASLGTRLRFYTRQEIHHDVYHVPSVLWFGRWLSMDEVSYARGRVDQDVFTQYKADHRMGLQFSDLWVYEPESVVRWFFRPAVTTNEDHNPFDPDHVSVQTGLSTLLDDLYLGVSYRCTAFLADSDRANSSTQHLVSLDTTLDHWQHAGRRYELDFAVRHIIDQNETSAMLNLTLFRSHGRGYRDHAPGEVDFRRERERRAFGTWQRSELGW